MHRRSPLVRAGLLAVAVLQLSAPGAAAWADAQLDAGNGGVPVHLESRSTGRCPAVHPPDCILHRYLATLGVAASSATVTKDLSAHRVPILIVAGVTRSELRERLPNSRAPPLLS